MKNDRGFTLLELIIAITLMAILVLVLSLGLRTGLRAWTRGKETNAIIVNASAVEDLLGRQMRASVTAPGGIPEGGIPEGDSDMSRFALFRGDEHDILFTTTSAPMGSRGGGIFLVRYTYDEEEGTLTYAQKIVTRPEDLDEARKLNADKDNREEEWETSRVEGIQFLSFRFHERQENGQEVPRSPSDWAEKWDVDHGTPDAVGLAWSFEGQQDENDESWRIFPAAPFPIEAMP